MSNKKISVKKVNLEQNKPFLFYHSSKVKNIVVYNGLFNEIPKDIIELYQDDYFIIRSFKTQTVYIKAY